jgi:8-oxo-dGTP diphosphatase
VQAAGGIVCHFEKGRLPRVAVVHRPSHADWTLPKGKVEEGESPEVAALREVEEETGLHCRLIRPAGVTRYVDRRGRDKVVSYWIMQRVSGGFQPNNEVDVLRWLTLPEAEALLTYGDDRALLSSQDLQS